MYMHKVTGRLFFLIGPWRPLIGADGILQSVHAAARMGNGESVLLSLSDIGTVFAPIGKLD
jgi:hypothetical protein